MSYFFLFFLVLSSLLGAACQQPQKQIKNSSQEEADWISLLRKEVPVLLGDESQRGRFGVYVKRLSDQSQFHWNTHDDFYFASAIKFFVLLESQRQIERGKLNPQSFHRIKRTDYRDGSGTVKWLKPGKKIRVKDLIEKMMIYSDNTATDILIEILGIESLNQTIQKFVPGRIGPITSLLDVRRMMYGELHPEAQSLSNQDYIDIRRKFSLSWRLQQFAKKIPGGSSFSIDQWDSASERYYARRFNSGSLIAYGDLLEKLVRGEIFSPSVSQSLLTLMRKCQTGKRRLVKGFSKQLKFAHKTGTQYKRICDIGVLGRGSQHEILLAVCAKGFPRQSDAEKSFAAIAGLVSRSGIF